VVLLMAGAWGIGPLDRLANVLVRDGVTVLAVAGANQRLYRKLQAVAARHPRILAFGYSDQIPELMSAADVVVTTPGDTCTEARLLERPMVLLDTVPGHGRENLELELARGAATAVPSDPEVVRDAVRVALKGQVPPATDKPPRREEWARTFLASLAPVGITLPSPS
jgi:UDP-N-acetylglucosamine:LPS N-acetylglucosamine transferase